MMLRMKISTWKLWQIKITVGRYRQKSMGEKIMQYRSLRADELNRELFSNFTRRQVVTKCWRKEKGEWKIKEVPFIDDWSEENYIFRHIHP